jgi:hypothetical protein
VDGNQSIYITNQSKSDSSFEETTTLAPHPHTHNPTRTTLYTLSTGRRMRVA